MKTKYRASLMIALFNTYLFASQPPMRWLLTMNLEKANLSLTHSLKTPNITIIKQLALIKNAIIELSPFMPNPNTVCHSMPLNRPLYDSIATLMDSACDHQRQQAFLLLKQNNPTIRDVLNNVILLINKGALYITAKSPAHEYCITNAIKPVDQNFKPIAIKNIKTIACKFNIADSLYQKKMGFKRLSEHIIKELNVLKTNTSRSHELEQDLNFIKELIIEYAKIKPLLNPHESPK